MNVCVCVCWMNVCVLNEMCDMSSRSVVWQGDLVQGFNDSTFLPWVEMMSDYVSSQDPYHHPISTSFSFSPGYPVVDGSPALDFTMTHSYGATNMVNNTVLCVTAPQPCPPVRRVATPTARHDGVVVAAGLTT